MIGIDPATGWTSFTSDDALDCLTGESLREAPSQPVFAPSTGKIYVYCAPNLVELDAKTGRITDYVGFGETLYGVVNPVMSIWEDLIFIPSGRIYAFYMAPLRPAWNATLSGEDAALNVVQDSSNNALYVGGIQTLTKLSSPNGRQIWSRKMLNSQRAYQYIAPVLDVSAPINQGLSTIYLVIEQSLVALDAASGKQLAAFNLTSYHGAKPGEVRSFTFFAFAPLSLLET